MTGSDVACVCCCWEFDETCADRWRLAHVFALGSNDERLGPLGPGAPEKSSDWVYVPGANRAATRWDWGRGVMLDWLALDHGKSPFTDEFFVSRLLGTGVEWESLLAGGLYLMAETTRQARAIVLGLRQEKGVVA